MTSQRPSPAELYETFYGPGIFRPLTEEFVEFAEPAPGMRVLDLACGTGLVARAIASRVGASGRVVGVDINPAMVAVARRYSSGEGNAIEWREGDAVTLDLTNDEFDLALCQQALQFFPDRITALSNVRGALVPGGRVAVAVWQGIARQPLFREFAEVEARNLEPLGLSYEDLIAPFSLHDPDELREILERSGFSAVNVVERTIQARFPDPDTFARKMETAYGAVVPSFVADPEAFEEFVEAVERETRDTVRRFTRDGMVTFPMPTHFARGEVM